MKLNIGSAHSAPMNISTAASHIYINIQKERFRTLPAIQSGKRRQVPLPLLFPKRLELSGACCQAESALCSHLCKYAGKSMA